MKKSKNKLNLAPTFRLRIRKDDIWEVVWPDPLTGMICRRSTKTRDEDAARVQLAQIAADAAQPKIAPSVTVGELIDLYLKRKDRENVATPHNARVIHASLRPVKHILGTIRWDQLSQDHIDDYVVQRLSQPAWAEHKTKVTAPGRTIGPSTVNKDLRMLRAALTDAHARRYIPTPVNFKVTVGASAPRDEWLTNAELSKMLALCDPRESVRDASGKVIARALDREHLYGFIVITIATAARKEAVLDLRWDQVHTAEGGIDLAKGSFKGSAYIDFGTGHGNKRRPRMPVGSNGRLMSFLAFTHKEEHGHVISYRGQPIKDIKKGFAEVLKEAGIKKKITPHSLKHTAITMLVQGGMPLETISDLTNTSVKILRSTYSHHRPDFVEALGSALSID